MIEKPSRQGNGRLSFRAGPFPYRKPVENSGIQIDKRFASRTVRRSGGDGTGTSPGIQANQNEPRHVP
jgi:hypothetical protein